MKNKCFHLYMLLFLFLLVGCSSEKTPLEIYSNLKENTTTDDKYFIDTLQTHVEKFDLLNKELVMVLTEMKKDDDLEAAIETLEIAKQEAQYIYNLIELEEKPDNKDLLMLQDSIQQTIENYIEGMNIQLAGITTGDTKKTKEGFEIVETAKQEIQQFLSQLS